MNIFFSSDSHFGHFNILRYTQRPFTDVQVMDLTLIKNWNDTVNKNDQVYFLGDLSFYNAEKTKDIINRLNGKKYWIIGNHDLKLVKNTEITRMFEWVKPIETIYIQDPEAKKGRNKIVLSHYPMLSWDGSHHGSWHLHGHAHGNCKHPSMYAADVGVDCWGYKPVSYNQIKNMFILRKSSLTINDK